MPKDADELLQQMEKAGIQLAIYGGGGWFTVPKGDLPKIFEDREAYLASRYGVSKRHYVEWNKFNEDRRCQALTKKGERCSNLAQGYYKIQNIHQFDPDKQRLCASHLHQTMNVKLAE